MEISLAYDNGVAHEFSMVILGDFGSTAPCASPERLWAFRNSKPHSFPLESSQFWSALNPEEKEINSIFFPENGKQDRLGC
jgi:hypothetical protein